MQIIMKIWYVIIVVCKDILKEAYDEHPEEDDELKEGEEGEDGEDGEDEINNWIIRFDLNETQMLDMNLTNEDIHYTLKTQYGDDIMCFYEDYNSDNKT